MQRLITILFLLSVSVTGNAQQQIKSPDRIKNYFLDRTKEIEIPVSKRHATVIHFPKVVQGVIGYGLTDGKTAGTYQFSNPKNSNVVTVRNVMDDKDCYMTVVMDNHPYIFHLIPSANPVITVKLESPDARKKKIFGPVSSSHTHSKRLGYQTSSLIQSIRKARSRSVWEQTYPQWYASAKRRKTTMLTETKSVRAEITDIHQFPTEDTLVFLGMVSNKTKKAIWLQPQALSVRVGERIYPAQLVDFTGEIAGKGKAAFALVLRGNSTGGREHLSIDNEFRVVLPKSQDPSCIAQAVTDLTDTNRAEPTILPQK